MATQLSTREGFEVKVTEVSVCDVSGAVIAASVKALFASIESGLMSVCCLGMLHLSPVLSSCWLCDTGLGRISYTI